MAGAAEPFDKTVAKNCPSNGRYYFCERVGEDGQPSRFPIDKALMVQPFEWPVGAKAGAWMIRYCRDQRAEEIIPHVAGRQQVIAHLQYPSEVCDRPDGDSDAALLAALTTEPLSEDDEEGSLKTARIDAKKRELALDLVAKEQRVVRRGAVNKELFEGFMLNRSHRLEVRDQSEAMFRPFKVLRVGGAAPVTRDQGFFTRTVSGNQFTRYAVNELDILFVFEQFFFNADRGLDLIADIVFHCVHNSKTLTGRKAF